MPFRPSYLFRWTPIIEEEQCKKSCHIYGSTKEAKEAAEFYTSIFFKNSKVKETTTLHNTPSGSVDILSIELSGQEFTLISAGPLFKFTPAVSFLVACAVGILEYGRAPMRSPALVAGLCQVPFCIELHWL
jgi:3-demethylubiquinone-9 3-methyltransferase